MNKLKNKRKMYNHKRNKISIKELLNIKDSVQKYVKFKASKK